MIISKRDQSFNWKPYSISNCGKTTIAIEHLSFLKEIRTITVLLLTKIKETFFYIHTVKIDNGLTLMILPNQRTVVVRTIYHYFVKYQPETFYKVLGVLQDILYVEKEKESF